MYLQYLRPTSTIPFWRRPPPRKQANTITGIEPCNRRRRCKQASVLLVLIPYPHSYYYQGWYEETQGEISSLPTPPLMGSAQNDQPSISKQHSLFTARGEKIKWIPDSGTWENLPLPLQTISPSPNKRLSLLQVVAGSFFHIIVDKYIHECTM